MSVSSPLSLCAVPPVLKPCAHFLKAASEHANRDPVVAYWCRLAALETGLKLDKKSKESLALLLPLMDWLEKEKKVLKEQEAISSEIVAAAHIENYANKLFFWADKEDRAARFGKNVVKSFYTAGILFDVVNVCFELSPENAHARKYAKWKAAHIHSCLKNGQTPIAGPVGGMDDDGDDAEGAAASAHDANAAGAAAGGWLQPQIPPAAAPPPDHQQPNTTTTHPVRPPPPASAASSQPSFYYQPAAETSAAQPAAAAATSLASGVEGLTLLTPEMTKTAQKYCKYAVSALDYDDRNTAIDYMNKALSILKTGKEE